MLGVVAWFSREKGYGFISCQETGKDYFCHWSGVKGEGYKILHENDHVTFDVASNEKGLYAFNIVVTSSDTERK